MQDASIFKVALSFVILQGQIIPPVFDWTFIIEKSIAIGILIWVIMDMKKSSIRIETTHEKHTEKMQEAHREEVKRLEENRDKEVQRLQDIINSLIAK